MCVLPLGKDDIITGFVSFRLADRVGHSADPSSCCVVTAGGFGLMIIRGTWRLHFGASQCRLNIAACASCKPAQGFGSIQLFCSLQQSSVSFTLGFLLVLNCFCKGYGPVCLLLSDCSYDAGCTEEISTRKAGLQLISSQTCNHHRPLVCSVMNQLQILKKGEKPFRA